MNYNCLKENSLFIEIGSFDEYGGEIEITSPSAEIVLQDLTGFEGRCAALFFTTDSTFDL